MTGTLTQVRARGPHKSFKRERTPQHTDQCIDQYTDQYTDQHTDQHIYQYMISICDVQICCSTN